MHLTDLDDFLRRALEPRRGLRRGQAFMNELYGTAPHLYHALLGTPSDPFYDDSLLWAAVDFVAAQWNDRGPSTPHS